MRHHHPIASPQPPQPPSSQRKTFIIIVEFHSITMLEVETTRRALPVQRIRVAAAATTILAVKLYVEQSAVE